MTESPRIITRSGLAAEGVVVSRIGCCAAYPPAPGTDCTEPVEARCVVPTTVEGSATAGKVATTIAGRADDAGDRRP